ncbi:hypothetical protein P3T25_007698 [Paraburkholderia sp. GAS32]
MKKRRASLVSFILTIGILVSVALAWNIRESSDEQVQVTSCAYYHGSCISKSVLVMGNFHMIP